MNRVVSIRPAAPADAHWVAGLIGEAFQPLAVAAWLVPDPVRRAQVLPANFRILVEHALAYGEVHVTDNEAGVAVWFPREGDPPPEPVAYQQRLAAACGEATPRFQHLDELFDTHHPSQPHHHLGFLAARPARQRQGLGSALLAHHHARLEARNMAAYLEASSPENERLYRRHGYRTMGQPFQLPDGTPMWPMWRPASRP